MIERRFDPETETYPVRIIAVLFFALFSVSVFAQPVDQALGVDSRVDYESMKAIGPWDDRNYQLTQEDLAILADNEADLASIVPVFYRVLYRREFPNTPRTGPVQYPRSTYNYFLMRFGGYLVGGQIHNDVEWDSANAQYRVITNPENPTPGDGVRNNIRALNGEVLVFPGAESAVSISPINDDIVVAGLNGGGGQEMRYSSDGGNTWNSAPDLTGGECCDPAMDWKSDGSFVYSVTLGGGDVWFYRSDDNGQTWDSLEDETPGDDRRELSGSSGGDDKEYIHVDRAPGSPFQDNIYITWHSGNVMQVATSVDDGNTFTIDAFPGEPRGIGSDITTDENGVIFHFWPAYNEQEIRLNRSADGAVTWTPSVTVADTNASFIYPLPSIESREAFIYVSADTDLTGGIYQGRMYAAWSDTTGPASGTPANNHSRIQLAYSDDGGDNWTLRIPHETADELTVDRWHQWLKVDKDGRVHVVFYDTRDSGDRTGVDFYHSYSEDGGDTWQGPVRLTSETSPNSTNGFEFGDYNGFDIGENLVGISIFSDNRAEGGGGNDMDVYIAPTQSFSNPELDLKDGFEDPPPPPPR